MFMPSIRADRAGAEKATFLAERVLVVRGAGAAEAEEEAEAEERRKELGSVAKGVAAGRVVRRRRATRLVTKSGFAMAAIGMKCG
jgi:hypothetical protein